MGLKKYLPASAKNFYRKLRWFKEHYNDIDRYNAIDSALCYGPVTYNTDGLVTCLNCDFVNDPVFQKAYAAAVSTNPWKGFTLQWRVYVVCWLANHVKHLAGDFVECGVNTGSYAKAIITYTNFNELGKTFSLLDTFDGLVAEMLTEDEKNAGLDTYLSQYKNVYEQVKVTFQNDKVDIIKGAVPGTLPMCKADKIAYLSIDMNNVHPEIAALEYFYDKVMPGGVIVLDDYGFPQHINQKKAFDNFARQKNITIFSIPTGQGIIFKQ